MYTFQTPEGRAGWDQIQGMTESVHAELEQMFWQNAKLDALVHGVGRTVHSASGGDEKVRLDAQKRECQAQMTFHAGRSLEVAMQIVYACGADRIMGRVYKGIDEKVLQNDRKSHNLSKLYRRIIGDLAGRNMSDAFEEVYQLALHKGVTDLCIDDELHGSYLLGDDHPFVVCNMRSVIDGAEMTHDHADEGHSLSSGEKEISQFDQLSLRTFEEFLRKADSVYYLDVTHDKRRNMGWARYSARDHEYGRPYVVAGIGFFARLVKEVIGLSNQQWTWHTDFRNRWHQRRQYKIGNIVEAHLKQSYQDVPELPDMKTVEQMEAFLQLGHDGKSFRKPETYKLLHKKLLV